MFVVLTSEGCFGAFLAENAELLYSDVSNL